ncbi:MAG: class A beta-lactamase, subclass A2 [Flavobacterium sp.]|nr:class A beta-lactamase, subclass A2 [Flavobacterium sp.]
MKFFKILPVILALFFGANLLAQTNRLKAQFQEIVKDKKATVGIAVYNFTTGDTLTFNNNPEYPTLSVYKFHVALAVLHLVDKGTLKLDQEIFVKKSELLENTHSPLRENYPYGNINIKLSELLSYMVSLSDNNACDILFRLAGGTKKVDRYIKNLKIKDTRIAATEEEMHQKWENQYLNTTSPWAAVQLLQKFYQMKILSPTSYDYLLNVMLSTKTGPDKIKGLLPKDILVAHKTGSSFRSKEGLKAAENDIGIVFLPGGQTYAIAVFVKDSMEDDTTNNAIIARVSKAVFDHYSIKK